MKKIKILLIIIFIIIVIVAIYFGINDFDNVEEQPQEISYKTVNMITSFKLGISNYDNIHPYVSNNREILYLDQLIFEPLLTITEDYNISNCLAKEWTKLDNKTYIIKLKENVKWHNQKNFSSSDVKFSIENLKSSKNSIYYENVKNIEKVEVVDNNTVRIELSKEIPFFEYNLIFPIISKEQYKNTDFNNSNKIPVGTGLYKISKIEKDKIELIKNEEYRDIENSNANFKTISVNIYENMGQVYNAFKLGTIDFIHTSNTNLEQYIGTIGYGKKTYPNREFDYISFNTESSILQFKEVRQAINYIIDKDKLIATILEEQALKSNVPLNDSNYLLEGVDFNTKPEIEKAKKTLEDAGWKYEYGIWQKEIDGITKTINIDFSVLSQDEKRVKVAEEIKMQLEAIGIKIVIKKMTSTQYENSLKNKNYEMILTGVYTSLSPDLSSFLGENNLANYKNEEIKSISEELNSITDAVLRKEKYERIFEICSEELPYIGLYRNCDIVVFSSRLRGEVRPNCYNLYYNIVNWYIE